ncbi:MAG: hypothetical protein JW847_07745 [Candidatus Omnitrophica bacterium]|nr:hypothetical protein [Candidatus Omnitrophota bacterium]
MNIKVKRQLFFAAIMICLILTFPLRGYAAPIQLFLDTSSEAVCGLPLEIEILVLNENGEVETAFEGKHELQISGQESGMLDKSCSVRSPIANFKKGKAFFAVEDSEEETVNLVVTIAEPRLSGQINLSFLDKDIFPPKIVNLFEESPGILKLEFNEELEEESAQEVKNYKAITNRRETFPLSIEYHRTYVFLKFEEHFFKDEEGYLELEEIEDISGNEISSGLKSPNFKGTCEDACPD